MYVVLLGSKSREALSDCIPELAKAFPGEVFTIEGSEEKGYKLRLEGITDEKAPRAFATKYLKTWMPKSKEDDVAVVKDK
jgi:hypothetical protein